MFCGLSVSCLSVVCQLSVSCLPVVCQLLPATCGRRRKGNGQQQATGGKQSAAGGWPLRSQAPSGQRGLTDVWRRAANAQLSSLSRALASIPTPLVARSIGGRNNRETVFNNFEMFSLLRISRVRRPPTVPNFKVGLGSSHQQDKVKTLNLGARGKRSILSSIRMLLHFVCCVTQPSPV